MWYHAFLLQVTSSWAHQFTTSEQEHLPNNGASEQVHSQRACFICHEFAYLLPSTFICLHLPFPSLYQQQQLASNIIFFFIDHHLSRAFINTTMSAHHTTPLLVCHPLYQPLR
jgi:hypothetical protein